MSRTTGRTRARRRAATVAAVVATMAMGLAACGDDGGIDTGEPADEPAGDPGSATSDVPCPFTADELADAFGTTVEEGEAPVDTPEPVSCAFDVEGVADVFVTEPLDDDSRSPEERYDDFEGSFGVEPLPELGDTAFVNPSETSSTPETDDVIYVADIYTELDGTAAVITVRGSAGEDARDEDVQTIVTLLAG